MIDSLVTWVLKSLPSRMFCDSLTQVYQSKFHVGIIFGLEVTITLMRYSTNQEIWNHYLALKVIYM